MIRSIIIEDEPLAAQLLLRHIAQFPTIQNLGIFTNAIEAQKFLESNTCDLLFLDLHLPKIKGLEFLSKVKGDYHVILTTAYAQYAVESYEQGVVDYLMKPIEFSRFSISIQRLLKIMENEKRSESEAISIKVNKRLIKINLFDIMYSESDKGYQNIRLIDGQVLRTRASNAEILQLLNSNFIQIHRAFLVNKLQIKESSHTEVVLADSVTLPIGRKYRASFQAIWNLDDN